MATKSARVHKAVDLLHNEDCLGKAMEQQFAQSRLDAAVKDAADLPEERAVLLDSHDEIPKFAALLEGLGLPAERATEIEANDRLPIRILTDPTPLEKTLWKIYSKYGMHEMLSMELVGALSKRIRTTLSSVKIRGLNARPDLNGKSATVIGPRNHQTGRVPVRVRSTGECVKVKPKNLWDGSEESDALPTVLELGAGDGHLSHHLAISLSGYAKLICSDTKPPKDAIGWAALSCEIRAMDSEKVTELLQPTIAIISWQPSGIDWTLHCRAGERCREYILLGESDSSTCGDGWATWGIVPENGYEYGLDEDSIAPYKQEGFERVELPDVTEYMICRFDSHASRGFSKAVSFKRLKPEGEEEEESDLGASVVANEEGGETLEESWERMQRSLAAGKAERLDVQMEVDVTDMPARGV